MNETDRTLTVMENTRSAREYFWFALIVIGLLIYLAAHTSDAAARTSDLAARTSDLAAHTSDAAARTSDLAAHTSDAGITG
jgi:hypothetical protein